MTSILQTVSCLDDYDPNALRVDKAIEAIRACLPPIAATETIGIRQALGRVHRPGSLVKAQQPLRRRFLDDEDGVLQVGLKVIRDRVDRLLHQLLELLHAHTHA